VASGGERRALQAGGIGRNPFLKFERLKTADDRFVVTPNYLTIHAYAAIDVKVSPVVLGAPGKLGGLEDIWRRR
jgi:hypothetical protein